MAIWRIYVLRNGQLPLEDPEMNRRNGGPEIEVRMCAPQVINMGVAYESF